MRLFPVGLLALVTVVSTLRAQDDTPEAASAYKALKEEFDAARRVLGERYVKAEEQEDKAKVIGEMRQLPTRFAPRFLALGRKSDPATAFDALAWIVANAPDVAEAGAAADLLAKDHLQNKKLGTVLQLLPRQHYVPHAYSEKLLRAVVERGETPERQGKSRLFLAQFLQSKAEVIERINEPDPESKKELEQAYGKAPVKKLANEDATTVRREAERLFEEVSEKHGTIKLGRSTLGTIANESLFEMRHLALGKVAPEVEGTDVDDKALKLSEYRGKVVVLVFWGTWCGPCRAMIPHERELVDRMKDKPFVLLGINSDTDRDRLKLVLDKEKMTWRHFFDGSTSGPIASMWNVHSWPTTYVLDTRGVIRAKNVRGEKLDNAVEKLLKEEASK